MFELLLVLCVFKWLKLVVYSRLQFVYASVSRRSSLTTLCLSLGCMSVSQLLAYISVSPSVSSPVSIFVFVNVGLGWRPRSPCAWQRPKPSPSLDMPTSKHFCSRQYWQRLRVTLLIWQFLSRWQVYTMFFWILRRKKPCNRHPRESE